VWDQVYQDRAIYNKQCVSGNGITAGYADYDDLVQHMCVSFQKNPMPDSTAQDQIMGLCQSVYCASENRASKATFCSKEEDTTSLIDASQTPKDLVRVIIFTLIVIAVLVMILTFLFKDDIMEATMFKTIVNLFMLKIRDMIYDNLGIPKTWIENSAALNVYK
jgi:hypothetical protein